MIPHPSKLHRLGIQIGESNINTLKLEKPIDPRTIGYTDFTTINEYNYQQLASKYSADVEVCPSDSIIIGKSYDYSSQIPNTANSIKS